MAEVKGNCIVAQSGGPTAVINASACGVIQEALKHPDAITGVYGAHNGILGVLHEDIFDLTKESPETIEAMRRTPAAALGSCRYKLKDLQKDRADYERILEVFRAHNIRYFFYIGGNDSMDTVQKVCRLAADEKFEMIGMGIPKTVDNDLVETDHCPGYGSVAKYLATATMEAGRDTEALYTTDTCTILEAMGRDAGWIAAATGVAHRCEQDAPHLVYLPEVVFSPEKFVADVKDVVQRLGRCVIVAAEGLKDEKGNYLAADTGAFSRDAFGHKQLGGVAERLKNLVETEVGVKCRYNKLGTCQRSAMHFASKTDSDEAYMVGAAAVRHAVAGTTGKMVSLVRQGTGPQDYACTTGLADLELVANGQKKVPAQFIDPAGNHITDAMRDYVIPLMRGEVPIEIGPDGLPVFMRFERHNVAAKTTRTYSTAGRAQVRS